MNAEEVRAIEHSCARLISRYANLNDAGDWAGVAALYSRDGRMSRPSDPDNWIVGREAVLAAFRARPARKTRHLCANIVIDVLCSSTARGESAMALFTEDAKPKLGGFHDLFVREDGQWCFAERRGYLIW